MEELIQKLADILEVENLDITRRFKDYDEWDSLTSLSVMAILDSDYHIAMNNKEIASSTIFFPKADYGQRESGNAAGRFGGVFTSRGAYPLAL